MKKWLRFFCLSFFSNRISKEGAKSGYTNVMFGLILAFAFLWVGYVGADMLPLRAHYENSPDFSGMVHAVLANPDPELRIDAEIKDGSLLAKGYGSEYGERLLVNTFENEAQRQSYSKNGYNVVVDMRPADTLAKVEAYLVSNDGKDLTITYEEYLTLSEVARLNFDFKLRYTGEALYLSDELTENHKAYLLGLGGVTAGEVERLTSELSEGKINNDEYARAIYELYFVSYYPEISAYESTSKVPLLRNYYYHHYISRGEENYLFIFDDYMAASFETKGGILASFYGFYGNMEDGAIVPSGSSGADANAAADDFMKNALHSIAPLTFYAHAMNVFTLIPFIALMPLVVTLLGYSILKLRGVDSLRSFGAAFKTLGSYVWFSALISAVLTVTLGFLLDPDVISTLPLILFFLTLTARSVIFALSEIRSYVKKTEETVLTQA